MADDTPTTRDKIARALRELGIAAVRLSRLHSDNRQPLALVISRGLARRTAKRLPYGTAGE